MVHYKQLLDQYKLAYAEFDSQVTSRINKLKLEFERIDQQDIAKMTEIKKNKEDPLFKQLFTNFFISIGLKVTSFKKGKYNILFIECTEPIHDEIITFALDFYENKIYPLHITILKDLFTEFNSTFGKRAKPICP